MGPAHSSSCWRKCGTPDANLTHIFWLCPELSVFWREIFNVLKDISKRHILENLVVPLLEVLPDYLHGTVKKYLLKIYNKYMHTCFMHIYMNVCVVGDITNWSPAKYVCLPTYKEIRGLKVQWLVNDYGNRQNISWKFIKNTL